MIVRPWVTFDSDLPYDGIEDETGFIQWPGKAVAEATAEILGRLGCTRINIDTIGEAGYEVAFTAGRRNLAARVTMIDNYVVCIHQYSIYDSLFNKIRPEFISILRGLNAELNSDGRFHQIRWFTGDEVFSGVEGALSPVED